MYIIENVYKLRRKRSMMQVNVKRRCAGVQGSPKLLMLDLIRQERVRVSGRKALDCRILKVVMMSLKMSKIHRREFNQIILMERI